MPRTTLLTALVAALPAFASETVLVDAAAEESAAGPRGCVPISACVTTVAEDSFFLIESGVDGRTADGVLLHHAQTIAHAKLHPRAELQVGVDGLALPHQRRLSHGVSAVQVGLKVSLGAEDRVLPSQDVSLHVTAPAGPGRATDLEAWWYQTKTFGRVRFDLNVMTALSDVGAGPSTQGMATFTTVFVATERARLFAEAYGTAGQTQDRAPGAGLLAGLALELTPGLVVDVAGEIARHDQSLIITAFAGLSFSAPAEAPTSMGL
jgi:hypothetical protein